MSESYTRDLPPRFVRPPQPDWPGPGEAAEAFEAAVNPADAVLAEVKAMAERAYGCQVEPKSVRQYIPATIGKVYVEWGPKRHWWGGRKKLP